MKQIKSSQMEAWISSKEMEKYLGVSRKTLLRMNRYFQKGIHWRHKDPLNPKSHKVWKRIAVDQLLSSPDHVLKRKIKKV